MRGSGFLIGGTAGRTTLNGEGLQHQDGHSHLLAAATLSRLAREGKVKANVAAKAFRDLEIDPERPDPVTR
jgi:pyruvate dehydrogenase complex dehydrogenase (E1) component